MKSVKNLLLALLLCVLSYQPASAATPAVGGEFTLTSHHGNPWSLQQARGKLVLLMFGYTSCPDVCPIGLLTVQQIMQQLGEQSSSVQPLFISVDPQRDTPEVLKAYVSYFHPSLIGLTGTPAELADITRRYSTSYSHSGDSDSSSYLVDHSPNLYIIDAQGQLASIIPYGTPTDIVLDSVKRLLPPQQ
jgi:cytochrome oxidase Cu insertion factor (SCO1/SenC/PrrC family)